jgi:hypothetical protein
VGLSLELNPYGVLAVLADAQGTGILFADTVATWPALMLAALVPVGEMVGVALPVGDALGVAVGVGVAGGLLAGATVVALAFGRGGQLVAARAPGELPVLDAGVADWLTQIGGSAPGELGGVVLCRGWVTPGWLTWFVGVINCCAWPSANTPATTMATAPATAMTGLSQEAAGASRVKAGPSRARSPVDGGWVRCAARAPCGAAFQPMAASSGRARAASRSVAAGAGRVRSAACQVRADSRIRVASARSPERAPALPDSIWSRSGRNQRRNSVRSTNGLKRGALSRPRIRSRPSAAGSTDSAAARSARRRRSS